LARSSGIAGGVEDLKDSPMSHRQFSNEVKRESDQESRLLARAETLEAKIKGLEEGLHKTQQLLYKLVQHLEVKFQEDIDDDGHIGSRYF
jgi:hypothetical protein